MQIEESDNVTNHDYRIQNGEVCHGSNKRVMLDLTQIKAIAGRVGWARQKVDVSSRHYFYI